MGVKVRGSSRSSTWDSRMMPIFRSVAKWKSSPFLTSPCWFTIFATVHTVCDLTLICISNFTGKIGKITSSIKRLWKYLSHWQRSNEITIWRQRAFALYLHEMRLIIEWNCVIISNYIWHMSDARCQIAISLFTKQNDKKKSVTSKSFNNVT